MIEGLYNQFIKDKFVTFDENMNRRALMAEVKDITGTDFSKRIQDCRCLSLSYQRN